MEEQAGQPPLQLALKPLAPNPVSKNGGAIAFTLPARGDVALRLYDISGRMVQRVFAQVQDAGIHVVNWMPDSRIASGHYYLKLHTSTGTITRSVTILH